MIGTTLRFVVIGIVVASLAACNSKRWDEDVKLYDGRVIIVQQKRLISDGVIGRESWISLNLPELGDSEIVWHDYLTPLVLNVHEGRLYVVAFPPTEYEFERFDKPFPPYLGYRWEASQWKRIPFSEIPEAIYDTNLVIDGPLFKGDYLTLDQKNSRELNGDSGYGKHHKRVDPNHRY